MGLLRGLKGWTCSRVREELDQHIEIKAGPASSDFQVVGSCVSLKVLCRVGAERVVQGKAFSSSCLGISQPVHARGWAAPSCISMKVPDLAAGGVGARVEMFRSVVVIIGLFGRHFLQ